jgi:hypothetical protein
MEERDPEQIQEEEEELAQVANAADPAQGFQIHEPTADELDADDGYVQRDDERPEPHDKEGTVDEQELAEEEGLKNDELAEESQTER